MTQTEALKSAIEFAEFCLEELDLSYMASNQAKRLVEKAKEALAQTEQERCVGCEACIDTACGRDECPKGWPKAAQPEQEPVLAAMKTVIESMQQDPDYAWGWHCNIAMSFVDAGGDHYTGNQGAARFMRTLANVEPAHELPSPPPQRTWVGLTNEEELQLAGMTDKSRHWLVAAVEAKLKEKNT